MLKRTAIFLASGCLVTLPAAAEKIDFVRDVKPIFEAACINCHGPKEDKGSYRMDTKEAAFKGGKSYEGETIVAKDTEISAVYWMTIEPHDSDDLMPPKKPLTQAQTDVIKAWIEQGAEWPEGVVLEEKPRMDFKVNILPLLTKGGPFNEKELNLIRLWAEQGAVWPEGVAPLGAAPSGDEPDKVADNLALVTKIREKIIATQQEKAEADMKDYTSEVPASGVKYDMIAIKGGEFLMGSPEDEAGRQDDEGPQHKVQVSPFWMGKYEVTWNLYQPFQIREGSRNKDGSLVDMVPNPELVDVVSSPTSPYMEMSFGMGTDGFPAICMTEHAANKFCQWLSAQTGHYYRLPTEAEWEYAARAGSTGPYPFPADQIEQFAVVDPQQTREGYEKVGSRKPNPWGLYDMHGNVMEWVIDQYKADAYASRTGTVTNPLELPTTLYPRVARGGSWYDLPEDARSARRIFSDPTWKEQDPQLPKSIWYHTDAHWLGFRIVRPLEIPDAETMHKLWNIGLGDE